MSDDTTSHGLTADGIRAASIESGLLVRTAVEALPDSASKTRFLALQSELEEFWRVRATDEFCEQWLLVALQVGS